MGLVACLRAVSYWSIVFTDGEESRLARFRPSCCEIEHDKPGQHYRERAAMAKTEQKNVTVTFLPLPGVRKRSAGGRYTRMVDSRGFHVPHRPTDDASR